jgi:uncharacterized membrane protein YraQ (UPF0718 family)
LRPFFYLRIFINKLFTETELAKGRKKSQMLVPTIIMGLVALVLFIWSYSKGDGQYVTGLQSAWKMTLEILPLLIFAFIVAGLIQVLIPKELLSKWVGMESGWRGLLVGTIAGGLSPGGPYVSLPIVAGLLRSGASVGTMVAFLTGWSLWAIARMPMEVGILGWKFTLVRFISTFIFPPIAGFLANIISMASGKF